MIKSKRFKICLISILAALALTLCVLIPCAILKVFAAKSTKGEDAAAIVVSLETDKSLYSTTATDTVSVTVKVSNPERVGVGGFEAYIKYDKNVFSISEDDITSSDNWNWASNASFDGMILVIAEKGGIRKNPTDPSLTVGTLHFKVNRETVEKKAYCFEIISDDFFEVFNTEDCFGYSSVAIPCYAVFTNRFELKADSTLKFIAPDWENLPCGLKDYNEVPDGTNVYISGFKNYMTAAQVKDEFANYNESLSIVDIDGDPLKDKDYVGTGAVITLDGTPEKKVTVVLFGDLDGDGIVTSLDRGWLLKLIDDQYHSVDEEYEWDPIEAVILAGDINLDGAFTGKDKALILKLIDGELVDPDNEESDLAVYAAMKFPEFAEALEYLSLKTDSPLKFLVTDWGNVPCRIKSYRYAPYGKNAYLSGFKNYMTAAEVKSQFKNHARTLSIVNINGEPLADDDDVGTGAVITLRNDPAQSVTVILFGDLDGDGIVDTADEGLLLKLISKKYHSENAEYEWDPIEAVILAGDLNLDGRVNVADNSAFLSLRDDNRVDPDDDNSDLLVYSQMSFEDYVAPLSYLELKSDATLIFAVTNEKNIPAKISRYWSAPEGKTVYLTGFKKYMTAAEVKNQFENQGRAISIVDINGNRLSDSDFVGTGAVISLKYDPEISVTVILHGDVNGDGVVSEDDKDLALIIITQKYEEKPADVVLLATDLDLNGLLRATDYTRLKSMILGNFEDPDREAGEFAVYATMTFPDYVPYMGLKSNATLIFAVNNGKVPAKINSFSDAPEGKTVYLTAFKKYMTAGEVLNEFVEGKFWLTIVDINGNPLADNDRVGTGAVIFLKNNPDIFVTVILHGDVDGDGVLSEDDYEFVRDFILGEIEPRSEAVRLACDVNLDGRIVANDYTKLRNVVLGKFEDPDYDAGEFAMYAAMTFPDYVQPNEESNQTLIGE